MKRNASVWLSGVFFAALLTGVSAAQSAAPSDSLADYARAIRKDKPAAPTKTFDNDNLPTGDQLSVVGPATTASTSDATTEGAASAPPDTTAASSSSTSAGPVKPPVTAQAQQQLNDDWKGKFSAEQDQINLLNRELTVAQKEYQLRAAAMYADAGSRLRDASDWDKQDAQYKSDIAEKQKALDDAKQKLDDMQEEARKAGVSSSVRDVQQDAQ
jgi:hypothetical protein